MESFSCLYVSIYAHDSCLCICEFLYVSRLIYILFIKTSESANIFDVENCVWLYEPSLGITRAREITAIVLLRKIKVAIEKCYKTLQKCN